MHLIHEVKILKTLVQAELGKEYVITAIETHDSELESFLFTLGCYVGEIVTVVSHVSGNYVIVVKDARYSIDKELASAIIL